MQWAPGVPQVALATPVLTQLGEEPATAPRLAVRPLQSIPRTVGAAVEEDNQTLAALEVAALVLPVQVEMPRHRLEPLEQTVESLVRRQATLAEPIQLAEQVEGRKPLAVTLGKLVAKLV